VVSVTFVLVGFNDSVVELNHQPSKEGTTSTSTSVAGGFINQREELQDANQTRLLNNTCSLDNWLGDLVACWGHLVDYTTPPHKARDARQINPIG
jgi:hypothetical protein